MTAIRIKVRGIILGILGLLVVVLVFRIIFDLLEASDSNVIVEFFRNISNSLIDPFSGVVDQPSDTNLNYQALVALGIYILSGIAISEIVTAFLYDSIRSVVQNIIDGIFKIIEFVILLRLIFDFFEISNSSRFASTVRDLTDWTQNVVTNQTILDDRINVSAFIILVLIVVIDIFTEAFLNSLFDSIGFGEIKKKKVTKVSSPTTIQPTQTPQPLQQNITINVPPAQTTYSNQIQPVRAMPTYPQGYAPRPQFIPNTPTPPSNPNGVAVYHEGKRVN